MSDEAGTDTGTPDWAELKDDWRTFQRDHSANLHSHSGTKSKVRGAFQWGWLAARERFAPCDVTDNGCGSCGDDDDEQCPSSQRDCGHHCNHSWTHDACCWCGRKWAGV